MINIRPSTEQDEEGIRTLFKTCFGKELSHEEWLWKYKRSYLGSSSVVAEDNENIVAHYGGFKMQFYSRGNTLNAYQGCDVMTHPKYRARLFTKRGIVVKIADAFYKANPMEFIFGFPSERHGRLMQLQLGWAPYQFISVLMKDERDFMTDKRIRYRIGWEFFKSDGMNLLWDECKDRYPLTIFKDSKYIIWRFRDNPSRKYEILTVSGGFLRRRPNALAIFFIQNEEIFLCDFFSLKSEDTAVIFSSLEHFAKERGLRRIRLWVNPLEKIYNVLRQLGYREEQGIPYSVRGFEGSTITPEFFMKNYCYGMGDYDAA
jgi:hypothetical protein